LSTFFEKRDAAVSGKPRRSGGKSTTSDRKPKSKDKMNGHAENKSETSDVVEENGKPNGAAQDNDEGSTPEVSA
jgi:hypothetical protein